MKTSKSFLFVCAVVVILSSCSPNATVVNPTEITIASSPTLESATSTSLLESSNTATIISTNTPIPTSSKTRINLSEELYLDENSSPENLKGEPFSQNYVNFSNIAGDKGDGKGFIYQYDNEEWVAALTWTRLFPFDDGGPRPNEGELRQHYVQVWKDGKMLYSYPIEGICCEPKRLVRYDDHWIFWFMDDWHNQGWIVRDGILLNDLYGYDNAFSVFLLNGKPIFFFRRVDQYGISFNGQEILLPYPNISYGPVCCESGGNLRWNPRATDSVVGFYVERGNSDYQYIEIGLR